MNVGTDCRSNPPTFSDLNRDVANVTFAIGSHLKQIEEGAFAGCRKLYQICFPASVEMIGNYTVLLRTAVFETDPSVPVHDIAICPETFEDGVRMFLLDEEDTEDTEEEEGIEDMYEDMFW